MKHFPLLAAGILTIAIVMAGCHSSTSPASNSGIGSMIGTVNGFAWVSTPVTASGGATAVRNGNILTITGVSTASGAATQITLTLTNPALATDSLGSTSDSATYAQLAAGVDTAVYASGPTAALSSQYSGAVTLTTYDTVNKLVSGSFSFVGRNAAVPADTVIVNNGSFYEVSW